MDLIEELVLEIEDPAKISEALAASGPYPLRIAFEMDKNVQKIIGFGLAAQRQERGHLEVDVGNFILERIQNRGRREIDDISLACFCYILEIIGFKKAILELGSVLSEMLELKRGGEMAFTLYFATHAIKVLTDQPDLREDLAYSDEEIVKAMRRIGPMREG